MIPRTSLGNDFAAARDYYLYDKGKARRDIARVAEYVLHDKDDRRSSDRVGFTQTRNLKSQEPHAAFKEMSETVGRQSEIKRAAGIKATGRKLEKPIYTLSLSWHPTEKPTRAQMVAAGYAALKAMDMLQHQVITVQHTDTDHPHIHMIVNRINPKTGVAHKLSRDRLILSRWASAYEKEHGKIFCVQREKNNKAREIAAKEKAQGRRTHAIVKDRTSMTRKQWQALKSVARFKDGLPDINADIVRDEAEAKKRLLDTPEAELSRLSTARQQVLSGKEQLVFRPKGAKGGKSKAKVEQEIEEKAAAIRKQQAAQIDHEAAQKIAVLQPKDWQQQLAKHLGPQVTKAWFADATFEKDELTMSNRFKADYVKANYLKGVTAALGKVSIRAANTPVQAVSKADGPVADPRTQAFAKWEISARNAMQDRHNEQRAALGNKQQRQRMKTEVRIERHYGEDRKAAEKALRGAKGEERVELEQTIADTDTRIGEMLGLDNRQFESAWLDLNTTHATESASLDQSISYGISAGYEIPSYSAEPSRGIGFDRAADPGMGRG